MARRLTRSFLITFQAFVDRRFNAFSRRSSVHSTWFFLASSRPSWTVLGRINSCMETIIFREKFLDWPDKSRVIGKRAGEKEKDDIIDVNVAPSWVWADLQGVDGSELAGREQTEPDLELEGSHLGRGAGYYDQAEMRRYEISSQSVTAWHVTETDYSPLPAGWSGQFHSEETYVVRWKYKVALTGRALQLLGGGASKHSAVGRDRCAYFFWQGADSKVALQGASALHTVELDSERGPQLRVRQGREHAAFLQLWQGKMVTLKGRRGESVSPGPRLFVIQAEEEMEAFAREVPCGLTSLRSRGVFLLLLPTARKIIVWSGRAASRHHKDFAASIAAGWKSETPRELGTTNITAVETLGEGEESGEFWSGVKGSSAEYQRLSAVDLSLTASPQLYHMTSVLGSFEVNQVKSEYRKAGLVNNLMVDQALLYEAEQPGNFTTLYTLNTVGIEVRDSHSGILVLVM